MKKYDNFVAFGTHDEKTLNQLTDVAKSAVKTAIMADGHMGYIMPVGGVAAYINQVSIAGVGYDIACGNCAIKTDLHIDQIQNNLNALADEIQSTISFGVGRSNKAKDAPVDDKLFRSDVWDIIPNKNNIRDKLRTNAREQLGTVGSGNHYVDVFKDETGAVWVGVHFGSRGLGHTIASNFLALGQNLEWGTKAPEKEILLDLDTQLGQDYWNLMELCGEYAYAGREWVTRKVVSILGGKELEMVHNHHNFAWMEHHIIGDNDYTTGVIVVRKGATPAWHGQKGFVGGSMGDNSVILMGNESSNSDASLRSTVHGAGRVMSRTEAAGKWDYKNKCRKTEGKVKPEMMKEWLRNKGVILRGGGLDESPHAYRRLDDVLRDQGDTIKILHTLEPLIVVMAGENEYDPYKDG